MYNILIHGPQYAVSGQTIYYDIENLVIPDDVLESDVVIKWFKNDIELKQYAGENQHQLDLFSVEKPAEGKYHAVLIIESKNIYEKSNDVNLEIGTVYRNIEFFVNDIDDIVVQKGEVVSIDANFSINPAECNHVDFKWIKDNDVVVSNTKNLNIVADENSVGEYTLIATATAHGGYTDSTIEKRILISMRESCRLIYIHNLLPARNAGFIQIGWWVLDEIIKANEDSFRWQDDPFNPRFLYNCELSALAIGFSTYPDLEVQESRHGYILYRKDLIK